VRPVAWPPGFDESVYRTSGIPERPVDDASETMLGKMLAAKRVRI
jgi:hypothetical protein